MATIPPHPRLNDVSNTALFRELTADNFTILAEEIGLRLASYQNGTPTTIIGPPTPGTFAQSPRLMQYAVNISSFGLSGSRPPLLPARTLHWRGAGRGVGRDSGVFTGLRTRLALRRASPAEFWRDALGSEWRCTGAGTPGTWIQIRPAAVTADPSSGTSPTGNLIWNVTTGHIKRHAGGFVWEIPAA